MKHRKLPAVLEKIHALVYSENYKESAKVRKADFTRRRKMDFVQTICFILSGTKKSLQTALNTFCSSMKMEVDSYSKQAFSKGRRRIRPEAFKELFEYTAHTFYEEYDYRTYRGYRVFAIDGTRYNLPNTDELRQKYGVQTSNGHPQVQALGSCLYDVLNGMLLDARFSPCRANEREEAKAHLLKLKEFSSNKELVLLDRGYPSADLIATFEEMGYSYIMRCSKEFLCAVKTNGADCVITHQFKKLKDRSFTLRVIRFPIGDGKDEILITNIFDNQFSVNDFKDLYKMRWSIESKYDDLKNKLEIENFSGTTEIAILQDYYATMFLAELAGIIAFEYSAEIEQLHNFVDNKHTYALNISMTISTLKTKVVELIMCDSKRKSRKILNQIQHTLKTCVVPVRPNRSFPRKKRHLSVIFPQNKKSL